MFDEMLVYPAHARRLNVKWSQQIPALVRMPLFSESTGFGYVVAYIEKTREYLLRCFDPDTGKIHWETNVHNGGYGAHAIGQRTIAVPTSFVNLTGIDAITGEVVWVHKTNARVRSPIAYVAGDFIFSSGQNIYRLTEMGEVKNTISLPEHFFFGLIKCSDDSLISLATFTNASGKSQLALVALSSDGSLRWKTDLGDGQVVSSDTSGFAIAGDYIYCAAGKSVHCIAVSNGERAWNKDVSDIVGRQMPTISGDKLFVPSIEGSVFCFNVTDGSQLWTFRGATIATTPISILGGLACVCLDGQLHLLDVETGRPFDQIPTGHSPYSAVTFWKDKAYLGGGDPPYYGRLYCFDCIDRDSMSEYLCAVASLTPKQDRDSFYLQVEVSNACHAILTMSLDASVIAAAQTNGGICQLEPVERSGNRFTFKIPIRETIVPGLYSVDFNFSLETGAAICRTGLISIESAAPRPKRHIIAGIQPKFQRNPLNSGAAAMQMLQEYYDQPLTDQDAIRGMVDYIRKRADYEPFNVWRLVLRRVISSNAQSKEYLPEYGSSRD